MIPREKILPLTLAVIDLGAAVVYAVSGNWRMTVYWGAACLLTLSITI